MNKQYFKIPNYTGACIYAIVNLRDVKMYIGQTTNARRRAKQHYRELKNGIHTNPEMLEDRELLIFCIIEKIDKQNENYLGILEKLYMHECFSSGVLLYNRQMADGLETLEHIICFDIKQSKDIYYKFKTGFEKSMHSSLSSYKISKANRLARERMRKE